MAEMLGAFELEKGELAKQAEAAQRQAEEAQRQAEERAALAQQQVTSAEQRAAEARQSAQQQVTSAEQRAATAQQAAASVRGRGRWGKLATSRRDDSAKKQQSQASFQQNVRALAQAKQKEEAAQVAMEASARELAGRLSADMERLSLIHI